MRPFFLDRRSLFVCAAAGAVTSMARAGDQPFRMMRAYVPGPFGQIHFRYAETGRPVVFLHQAQASSRQFDRVYPLFAAKGFRPIGIDLPGYGGSDPTDFIPKVEDWAKIIPPVLSQLQITKADFVGHHTGAPVATEFALQSPQSVGKLVLHGALLVTEEERAKRLATINRQSGPGNFKPDGSHLAEAFVSRSKMHGPAADPKLMTEYIVDRFSATGPSWYAANASYTYDHGAALSRTTHPTLVINNDGDQIYELTARVRVLRPDIKYVEMKGGTVDMQDQAPEAWTAIIVDFLNAP